MAKSDPHEDNHNNRLAQLLREKGLDAQALYKFPNGKFGDIYVVIDRKRICLEAKVGIPDIAGDNALSDAAGRLAEDLADTALGICYPHRSNQSSQLTDNSKIWVSPIGGSWHEADIEGIAGIVKRAAMEVGDVDAEAKKLQVTLLDVQERLCDSDLTAMSRAAGMPMPTYSNPQQRKHAGMRVLLLVFAAAMFHAKLDPYFAQSRSRPAHDAREKSKKRYEGNWPPPTLQQCIDSSDCVRALADAWDIILAKDYKPIYETGRAVLMAPPSLSSTSAAAIKKVVAQAQAVHRSLAGGNHDLLGRIFHWILDTSKNDGSYYTSTAAATLLAGLAIREEDVADLSALKILDPACGTGTLLMAAAERIADLKGSDPHTSQYLVERVLHGWDINISAAHLAATTLGLTAPDVSFDKMNIHMLKLGLDDTGKARAGSLEMMQEAAVQTQFWAQTPSAISAQVDDTTEEQETESLSGDERYDIVIMNPPFTADSKRHDQLGTDVEMLVKDREEILFSNTPAKRTHPGGMFLLLAQKLVEGQEGTIAAVLPSAGATNPSTAAVWQELFGNFRLDYVISSHDPTRISFSENTSISEMLVLLREKEPSETNSNVKFIRLAINPSRPSTALGVARSISQGDASGLSGTITLWPHERVEKGNWSPIKFFSDFLATKTWEWFDEDKLNLFHTLETVADVGPDGRGIRGAFTRSDTADSEGMQALWFNDQSDKTSIAEAKICMEQNPDSYIHSKKGRESNASSLWEQKGYLFIPARIRTTSAATVSIRCTYPVLGSAWVPVRHKTETLGCDWEKAICVYLNSTVGILASLSKSSLVVLGRPEMSLDGQRRIPIPKLDEAQIKHLATVYDTHKHTHLERLRYPDSASRIALDQSIAETIGIPIDQINTARRELAKEPGVTAKYHESVTQNHKKNFSKSFPPSIDMELFRDESFVRSWSDHENIVFSDNNNTFRFIDSMPAPFGRSLREIITKWWQQMPEKQKIHVFDEMQSIATSNELLPAVSNQKFKSCFWEMFIHETFKKIGYTKIIGEYSNASPGNKSIDFYCEHPVAESVLIECMNLSNPRPEQVNLEAIVKNHYKKFLEENFSDSETNIILMFSPLSHFFVELPSKELILEELQKVTSDSDLHAAISTMLKPSSFKSLDVPNNYRTPSITIAVTPMIDSSPAFDVSITHSWTANSSIVFRGIIDKIQSKIDLPQATPFIIALTSDKLENDIDNFHTVKNMFYSENGIFANDIVKPLSGILIGSPLPWKLDYYQDFPFSFFPNGNANHKVNFPKKIPLPFSKYNFKSGELVPSNVDLHEFLGLNKASLEHEREIYQMEKHENW